MTDKTDTVDESIIEDLCNIPNVGKKTAIKIFEGNYMTIKQIAAADLETFCIDTGIGETGASNIITSAREIIAQQQFIPASKVLKERKNVEMFTSGIEALDEILGGGLETKATYEIGGEFRTGKTQLAHQLCVTVQLPKEKGGLGASSVFIDCEKTFRPERLVSIINKYQLDEKAVLNRVFTQKVFESDQLFPTLKALENFIEENNIRLIVIDSIIIHFRSEYIGRSTLGERQGKLAKTLNIISKLVDNYNITVVYTNQAVSDPSITWGNPTKPTGGNIMAHAATFRLFLRKSKQNIRIAKLIDSPNMPEAEATFKITEDGVEDV